jgi:transcriptional regulator with XRE-family HTH domain
MTRKSTTLGGLIRALRRQKNWTLRQMSEKVGIPLSTLAKVEQDKLSLTYDKLQQFTSRLGLTMAEFLAQADPPAVDAPQVVTSAAASPDNNSIQISTRTTTTVPVRRPRRWSRSRAHQGARHRGVW